MTTKTLSKKAIAAEICKRMISEGGHTRKDIIAEFVDKAGLTQQGASTYYSNFKRRTWTVEGMTTVASQPLAIVPESVDLSSMTDLELVVHYNKYATIPVESFATRDEALTAIAQL